MYSFSFDSSSTVLIDKDCNLRLTDFTNAKIFNPTTQVITRETELGTTARDMFSVGCIMAELLLRRSLFPDVTVANQLKKMYFKRKYALTGRQQNALNVGGAIPLFSQLNLSVDVEAEKRPREKTHEEILGALAPSPAQPLMNGYGISCISATFTCVLIVTSIHHLLQFIALGPAPAIECQTSASTRVHCRSQGAVGCCSWLSSATSYSSRVA